MLPLMAAAKAGLPTTSMQVVQYLVGTGLVDVNARNKVFFICVTKLRSEKIALTMFFLYWHRLGKRRCFSRRKAGTLIL